AERGVRVAWRRPPANPRRWGQLDAARYAVVSVPVARAALVSEPKPELLHADAGAAGRSDQGCGLGVHSARQGALRLERPGKPMGGPQPTATIGQRDEHHLRGRN